MYKKFIFMLPISLILVGCAQQGSVANGCDVVVIEPCTGNPPAVTLNTNGQTVAPPHFCVKAGATVTFNVTPENGGVRTVATIPKNPTDFWLIGTNDPNQNGFELTAPDSTGDYDYFVVFKDGHCIDPRISVE
jgi:hypothetical protein